MSKTEATNGERKTRTPRQPEAIMNAVMALPLGERVNIWKALKVSINEEVGDIKAQAENAAKIAEGV